VFVPRENFPSELPARKRYHFNVDRANAAALVGLGKPPQNKG
jgi:hypothetical protein